MPSPAAIITSAVPAPAVAPVSSPHALRTFLVVTFAGSAALWTALAFLKERPFAPLLLLLLMWTPGLAAIFVRRSRREPACGIGWTFRHPLVAIAGYAIPILYAGGAYAVLWATHAVGFAPFSAAAFVPNALALSVAGVISALGEELGWRGALVPLLARRRGFTAVALISGAIWAVWHFPVFALGLAESHGGPLPVALAIFTLLAIEASFIAAWLRLASNSVWPSTLFHASHNVFVLHVLAGITTNAPLALKLAGETSLLLVGACALPAAICWALGVRLPRANAQ